MQTKKAYSFPRDILEKLGLVRNWLLLLLRRQALEYIMRRASREKLANYVNYVGDTTFAMRKFTANAKQQNEIID